MKAVDNTVRRSWDKEEYEKKAKDRAEQEKDEVSIGKTTRVSRGRPGPPRVERLANSVFLLHSYFPCRRVSSSRLGRRSTGPWTLCTRV